MRSLDRERPTCRRILFAVFIWSLWQLLITCIVFVAFFMQQLVLLPFRPCGGRSLKFMQQLTAPVMALWTCIFVTTSTGEPCYGANIAHVESFDGFVQKLSAARRKNIKRNLKTADEEMRR